MSFFKKAKKNNIKIKLAIMGPSASGKTYGALRIATELANGGVVALLDSEGDRGLYEADNFEYLHGRLEDLSPEGYINKIKEAEKGGVDVLIIDSISHEWELLIEEKDRMPGNGFQNFSKVTPRHNAFVKAILDSPMHIIATIRGKDKYILEPNSKGKMAPRKVSGGFVQRDNIEYEFTSTIALDHGARAMTVMKDSTNIFKDGTRIEIGLGKKLYKWSMEGIAPSKELVGTKNAIVFEDWALKKHKISAEDLNLYIKKRFDKFDLEHLTVKEYEDFKNELKLSKYDIKAMIKESSNETN